MITLAFTILVVVGTMRCSSALGARAVTRHHDPGRTTGVLADLADGLRSSAELSALVLATGLIVDDAIVVLENTSGSSQGV